MTVSMRPQRERSRRTVASVERPKFPSSELAGGGGDDASHVGEAPCGVLVVLCAGVREVMFGEAPVDRQRGGRVDRLVGGNEIGPTGEAGGRATAVDGS
jgi:hypothetical protein